MNLLVRSLSRPILVSFGRFGHSPTTIYFLVIYYLFNIFVCIRRMEGTFCAQFLCRLMCFISIVMVGNMCMFVCDEGERMCMSRTRSPHNRTSRFVHIFAQGAAAMAVAVAADIVLHTFRL